MLAALADRCEATLPADQGPVFNEALNLLFDMETAPAPAGDVPADMQWIALLADSGAFESAIIATMPADAVFTGGRLADGSFVAQVLLANGVGSHSRAARSLAMAWLAALLRATARAMIEAGQVTDRV